MLHAHEFRLSAKMIKVKGCAWLDAHQSPEDPTVNGFQIEAKVISLFSFEFAWQLPGESERAQTWFRGRKARRVLWNRGAQSCVRHQLAEEQLLNKMAWGTALNSSMPQNAPRLPPSDLVSRIPICQLHFFVLALGVETVKAS
jgi:hypothetical protein